MLQNHNTTAGSLQQIKRVQQTSPYQAMSSIANTKGIVNSHRRANSTAEMLGLQEEAKSPGLFSVEDKMLRQVGQNIERSSLFAEIESRDTDSHSRQKLTPAPKSLTPITNMMIKNMH